MTTWLLKGFQWRFLWFGIWQGPSHVLSWKLFQLLCCTPRGDALHLRRKLTTCFLMGLCAKKTWLKPWQSFTNFLVRRGIIWTSNNLHVMVFYEEIMRRTTHSLFGGVDSVPHHPVSAEVSWLLTSCTYPRKWHPHILLHTQVVQYGMMCPMSLWSHVVREISLIFHA